MSETVTETSANGGQGRRWSIAPPSLRRTIKRRPSPPAPAARFDPGHVGEPKHRNPLWLAGGLLLVVLCGLGGVLLFTSADDRVPVVVAAAELEPGRPLTRSDLRVVDMTPGAGVASLSPDAASDLIGQIPVGRVPEGTLLNPAMFVPEVPLARGEMVVGAALDPGEAPLSQVDVGDEVELLFAPKTPTGGAAAAGAAEPEPEPEAAAEPGAAPGTALEPEAAPAPAVPRATSIGSGVVWAVETLANGQIWVSIRMPKRTGLVAAQAAQDDALRVVLDGGGS